MKDQTVIYKSYDNMYKAMYERDFLRENGVESFLSEDSTLPLDPTLTLFSYTAGAVSPNWA